MPDYPGVDPDGLIPGGLQVAGKVNASVLAVGGVALAGPSEIAGIWHCNNGVSIANNAGAPLLLDTEDVAIPDVTYVTGTATLTFTRKGVYLAILDAYSNVGWSAGALKVNPSLSNAGVALVISGALGSEGSTLAGPVATFVGPRDIGDTIAIGVFNATGVTDTIFGDITIYRLA